MKKHPEYLAGERAKIHDSYMMKAWEEEETPPIPQILVDCGEFGLVPTVVSGVCPTCTDPFPDLQQRKEEKLAQERERRERYQRTNTKYDSQYDAGPYAPNYRDGDRGKSHTNTGSNKGGFVDVDDIQDEKVELSFENIALPLPPPKKKKKKKKKIL